MSWILAPFLACTPIGDADKPVVRGPERVTFTTDDRVEIVGDLTLAVAHGPVVLCLPMNRSTRATYSGLAAALAADGLNVLTLDLRGHGESGKEFTAKVEARDTAVFNEMHRDVAAAIAFLGARGFDTTRIGLIGASVGCSVAVASTVRAPGPIRAVALLTPGAKYLGVDTVADAEKWPGQPLWIGTSSEELASVETVATVLKKKALESDMMVIDGKGLHGTALLGRSEVMPKLSAYFRARLGDAAVVCIPRFAGDDPRIKEPGFVQSTVRIERSVAGRAHTLMAFAVGDTVTLGAMVRGEFVGTARLVVDGARIDLRFNTQAPAKEPIPAVITGRENVTAAGQQAHFRETHWITVELSAKEWFAKAQTALALELIPERGDTVRLPIGTGTYGCEFVDR
ncbi:MAG: alpha/beta fold hydrolase [Planctomycetota bacterium]